MITHASFEDEAKHTNTRVEVITHPLAGFSFVGVRLASSDGEIIAALDTVQTAELIIGLGKALAEINERIR